MDTSIDKLMYYITESGLTKIRVNGQLINYCIDIDRFYILDGKHIIWLDPKTIVEEVDIKMQINESYIEELNKEYNNIAKEYLDK